MYRNLPMPDERLSLYCMAPGCGFGNAACEYAAALAAQGVNLSWEPQYAAFAEPLPPNKLLRHAPANLRNTLAGVLRRHSQADVLLVSRPSGDECVAIRDRVGARRNYVYVAWELGQLRPGWAEQLNSFDGVMVPSEFNRQALLDGGVEVPVTTIPHIARTAAEPAEGTLDAVDAGDFVFYSIGTWGSRKGFEDTVRAYLSTFTAADAVALVLRTGPLDYMASVDAQGKPWPAGSVAFSLARIIADYPDPARVHLLADTLSPEEVDALHQRGDCFLSLSHSEGWGLGAFDALLHGNPVVITGFGGQLDYLGTDYPLAVDYRLGRVDEVPADSFFAGLEHAQWAYADQVHAGALMRDVYAEPGHWRGLAREKSAQLSEHYSAQRVGTQLAGALGLAA